MSEVRPVAIVFCLRGESYAGGHFIEVQLRITPGIELPIGARLYDEHAVAELREKFDEQVQITARIANENASNRLRAERAEARVAELERFHDVVQTAMQIHVIDEDAIKWIEQQLAAMQGGEA